MPSTPGNLPYPAGTGKLGLVWQYIRDLAIAVEGAAWTNITFAGGSGWLAWDAVPGTTFHIPGFKKAAGRVRCRGAIKNGAPGVTVFIFPAGSRPLKVAYFDCPASTGIARCSVDAAGVFTVLSYLAGGTNAYVFLDKVSFDTI